MIAIDTSAIVAVARGERDPALFLEALLTRDCVIGAPTVQEAHQVLLGDLLRVDPFLDELLLRANVEIVAVGPAHLAASRLAFDLYGKGRHAARLNLGDCFAYAVAKVAGLPLLYKGNDFALTDLYPALLPEEGA